MYVSVIQPNDHHTESYNFYHPILRRGCSFQIKCNSHRFKFYRNKEPAITLIIQGHIFKVNAKGNGDAEGWKYSVKYKENEYGAIQIGLTSPSDAAIGKYSGRVVYSDSDEDKGYFTFVLFFNPWDPRDITFMKKSEKLTEYILNENAKIFMGTKKYVYGSDWYLGQFQRPCIESVLLLLDRIPFNDLKNPILVSRYMSALVNSNDDNGIVMGSWNGNYADGTNPNAWRSSVEIMRKYANNKIPVKYGQCWVFGAILCSVCRCIGIPNRIITAFDAFHDGDKSLEWELYYDENLNLLNKGYDSCWNFHVWTEVWLERPDIGSKYDGWQILDATPQERSNGIFRVGPAPKLAVKEGYVKILYDVGFVFAEVNADKVHYIRKPNGKFEVFKVEKGQVSTKILTKRISNSMYQDITEEYKYPDGSVMDKVIDSRIMSVTGRHTFRENNENSRNTNSLQNLKIKIIGKEKINLGDNFYTTISIKSDSNKILNGNVSISVLLVTYTRKIAATLLTKKENLSGSKTYKIDDKTISKKVKNEVSLLKVVVTAMTENGNFSTKTHSVVLIKPSLSLRLKNEYVRNGKSTIITVIINNTLMKKIKNAKIYIESQCLSKRVGERIDVIDINSIIERPIKIRPIKSGTFSIWAYLDSDTISGFHTSITLNVT